MAKVTKYVISDWQASKGVFLVKTFGKGDYGTLKKGQPGIIFDGFASCFDVDLAGLATGIANLDKHSCIGLGNCGQEKVKVTTAKNDGKKGKVARTKDNFKYCEGEPAFLYFDMDNVAKSPEEALKILEQVVPDLADAGKLIVFSSSAGISDSETGVLLSTSTSAHIYIEIEDGSDATRFLDTVFDRLALLGYGKIELSAAPSFLRRGIIDKSVSGSERLCYEGSPTLGEGLTQNRPEPKLIEGGTVDTSKTKALSEDEQTELVEVWKKLKKEKQPELGQAESDKAGAISKERKVPFKAAEDIVRANQKDYIEDSLILHFKDHGDVVTSDVLADGAKYNNCSLADPLEPSYDGSSLTKAKFFWNNGEPKIYSQAHGGISYTFMRDMAENEESQELKDDITLAVDQMNKRHAACLVGGKFVIIKEKKNPMTGITDVSFLKQDTFRAFYKPRKVFMEKADGTMKPVEVTAIWSGHEERRTYEDFVFDPSGGCPSTYYNMFRGFNRVKPAHGDWSLLKELMLDVMCSGRVELYRYAMAWFQNILRNPSRKSGVALVFYGGQGCGKGTVLSWFREIFKAYYLHLTDGNQLTGNFNKQLFGKLLVFADEAMFVGDKRVTDKMKGLITEDTIQIEYKGVDTITSDNFMNIVVASNNNHVVDAGEDERRYAAYRFSNEKAQDKKYFGEIKKQRNNGGLEALCHHLLTTDEYDDIDISVAPDNVEIIEQKGRSLSPIPAFWKERLSRGYILTPPKGDIDLDHKFTWINDVCKANNVDAYGLIPLEWEEGLPIRCDFIYDEYLLFCKETKVRFPESSISFWQATRRADRDPIFIDGYKMKTKRNSQCFFPSSLVAMRQSFNDNVVHLFSGDALVDGGGEVMGEGDVFAEAEGGMVPFKNQF